MTVTSRAKTIALLAVVVVGLGLLAPARTVSAATTRVVPTQYASIQAAVNAASDGDTIKVLPGTYTEQLSIAKNVTIKGAGAFATTIRAPGVLIPGSFGKSTIVDIHSGAMVRISQLTVAGPGAGTCADGALWAGIYVVEDATLDLSLSAVTHIHDTPIAECFPSGAGIRIGDFLTGTTGHATIRNVVVSDFQFAGITVANPGSTATISGNIITGVGPSTIVENEGIDFVNGAVATVTFNRVSGNSCDSVDLACGPDPLAQLQVAGIFGHPGLGSLIAYNNLSGNDTGIYLFNADLPPGAVSHNLLTNNRFWGMELQDGTFATSQDRIFGGIGGIAIVATAVDTVGVLTDEVIRGTSGAPIQQFSCCGFAASAIVRRR